MNGGNPCPPGGLASAVPAIFRGPARPENEGIASGGESPTSDDDPKPANPKPDKLAAPEPKSKSSLDGKFPPSDEDKAHQGGSDRTNPHATSPEQESKPEPEEPEPGPHPQWDQIMAGKVAWPRSTQPQPIWERRFAAQPEESLECLRRKPLSELEFQKDKCRQILDWGKHRFGPDIQVLVCKAKAAIRRINRVIDEKEAEERAALKAASQSSGARQQAPPSTSAVPSTPQPKSKSIQSWAAVSRVTDYLATNSTITRESLAAKAGMSDRALRNFLRTGSLSNRLMENLAHAINLRLDQLIA